MDFFVTCPKGLEEILAEELTTLGAEQVKSSVAGVYVTGDLDVGYRICLWSRLANRVLLTLAQCQVDNANDLYRQCYDVAWGDHIPADASIAVHFSGTNDEIRNTRFGAQKVKDAIVDRLRDERGVRPNVSNDVPDIQISAHLSPARKRRGQSSDKAQDSLVISLELSGGSLHKRGYRAEMVAAPLKENLAAALLIRAGWPEIAQQGGALIDPLCGSGTLLIEGAMLAADIAPNLIRRHFGFERWIKHDPALWQQLLEDARLRKRAGLEKGLPEIRGYDKDVRSIEAAETNILHAGLESWVRVSAKPLEAFKKPTHTKLQAGLIICNPPYGERWGDVDALRPLYQTLGERMKAECPGWRMAVFTGNPDLAGEMRLRAERKYKLFNGALPAQLLLFQLRDNPAQGEQDNYDRKARLSDGAVMLLNRLKKNHNRLKNWLKPENICCYRLYDADLPEYAVAIDLYNRQPVGGELQAEAVHIQEYAPPATVDTSTANARLSEVRQVLLTLFPEQREQLFFKERRKQKGSSQYRRQQTSYTDYGKLTVSEGPTLLEVNLGEYLDTGLFLDHRPVRKLISDMATGTRFLNLFCYTATATVHAALGGAVSSLSIDMSNNYLAWAKRNFDLNKLNVYQHSLIREDCLVWLEQAARTANVDREMQFDLILLDPPTFSNSSKMEEILDIQRDHARLINQAMQLLSAKGTLVFSNNFRKFKMDPSIIDSYSAQDITRDTIPPDFARNQKIHHCWIIRHEH